MTYNVFGGTLSLTQSSIQCFTPESFRCPVAVYSVNRQLQGSPMSYSRCVRSLHIPAVINDRPPGRSVISEPDVNEIGCTNAQQFQWSSLVQCP